MKHGRFQRCVAVAAILAALPAYAQLPVTQLTSVFPPGGKQGSTVEVTIAGNEIDDVQQLVFNHAGLSASAKLSAVSELTPAQPVPNQFVVKVGADVPPGVYEVRAVGRFGVSNPRAWSVGLENEVVESSDNGALEKALELPLGTTVNGRAAASAYEFFRIKLKQGERVLVDVAAKRIDSRMDATLVLLDAGGRELARAKGGAGLDPVLDFTAPAAGPYLLKLYDAVYGGGDDYFYRLTVSGGPFVKFVFPPSGPAGSQNQYYLYGCNLPGGELVRNLTLDGLPLERVPVIISLPGDEAARTRLAVTGLAPLRMAWLDGSEYRLATPHGIANPVSVYFSKAPTVVVEQEPNDRAAEAQRIAVPCEVVGQFYPDSDVDNMQFTAKKGETLWIEAISSQLGLTSDPVLSVSRVGRDASGQEQLQEIAQADDAEERARRIGGDYDATSDDPAYRFVAPEDGAYRITIRDQFGDTRKDPSYMYRLAIRRPDPDFRLLVYSSPPPASQQQQNATPLAAASVRRGGTSVLGVTVQRRDEFDGEVSVEVRGLPGGVTCAGAVLGGNIEEGSLVFVAAEDAPAWAGPIQVIGKATVAGREVVREARYAVAVWGSPNRQQQAAEFRLSPSLSLGVIDKELDPALVRAGDDKVWEVPVGGKLEIPVSIARRGEFKDNVKLTAVGLPQQLRPKEITFDANKSEDKLDLRFDRDGQKPGAYTFYLKCETKSKYMRNQQAVAAAETEQKRVEEMIKKFTQEVQSATEAKDESLVKALQEKLKQAEELKSQAEKRTSEVKQQNQAKDLNFALVSTPVRVRVLPAPAKK